VTVAGRARDPRLPDVPAISEVLPGFEVVEWYGVVAPPKTPAAIAEKLSKEIAETMRMSDVAKRLAQAMPRRGARRPTWRRSPERPATIGAGSSSRSA
jgi:tripartite-type tricarboxylate transporter receptor subunit TctC